MEITIISAQGLKKPTTFSSIFSTQHLKPYITLTTTPPSASHGGHVYTTTVDHEGGVNPTWGDKFDLSNVINDATFFNNHNKSSYIYLEVYTKRVILGPRFLGWCGIPASDIADGFSPVGTARRMSYRLRKKDGSKGHGVVNVMVKLDSSIFEGQQRRVDFDVQRLPEMSFGPVAIGIPVKVLPAVGNTGGLNSVNVMRQSRYMITRNRRYETHGFLGHIQ